MNGVDLSGLKGLHIPSEPDIFPLALGWWLALIALILIVVLVCWGCFAYFQSNRRIIAKELHRVSQIQDTKKLLVEMNNLAKKVAILKFGREKIAPLYEQEWIDFLNSGKKRIFSQDYVDILCKTLYTKNYKLSDSWKKRILQDYSAWILANW